MPTLPLTSAFLARAARPLLLAAVLILISAGVTEGLGQTPARSGLPAAKPVANYPLQILHPRAAGSSPEEGAPAISPAHRIFWAYPGLLYNIRAAVIGGVYPYTHRLTNAPAGMTIDPATGEINWPAPRSDAAKITLTVRDAVGAEVQTEWSIRVDKAKFIFVAAGRSAGSGTLEAPYPAISAIPAGPHVGKIAYFRKGTYNVLDLPFQQTGTGWDRVEFKPSEKPTAWLAYPGETPVLDFGYQGSSIVPLIRLGGDAVYLDGFETAHSHNIAFQFDLPHYGVVRRMNMHHHGPGRNGANSAFLMFLTGHGNQAFGMTIQDNLFSHLIQGTSNCALKLYSTTKALIEGNSFHTTDAPGEEALVALKADNGQFTVRRNTFYDLMEQPAIGGNMHRSSNPTYGEILFNHVQCPGGEAINLNQDGQATRIDVYRNTFQGRVRILNTDADDGPFSFSQNIIVSTDRVGSCVPGSRIFAEGVTARERVIASDNLEGAPDDHILDATGKLTAAFQRFRGTYGDEQTPSAAAPIRAPARP